MTTIIQTTDISSQTDNAITVADAAYVFVKTGVAVTSASQYGILSHTSLSLIDNGEIFGYTGGVLINNDSTSSLLYGSSLIINANASIQSISSAVINNGEAEINNDGSIQGGGYGIYDQSTRGDLNIINTGQITGNSDAIYGGTETDHITNSGILSGNVVLGSGGGTFNSSGGQVIGSITAGSGGDAVVAGWNGGVITGSSGNDNLQANRSQVAADDKSRFALDGRGGNNALYGGGAFTTFAAGDAAGGHNQIHGGLSKMSDVLGYHNNTVDFSSTSSVQSVYVDLLSGHDAYLYSTNNHAGSLTFEDAIQNVPDVIGSSGGDSIRADNTGDTIQGGGGADILYGGTGPDTFVYKGYGDSNTVAGYDTISGFQTGTDKLDLSAFNANPNRLAILSGNNSTTLYLEQTAGKFVPSTDLAISILGANAIKVSDVTF